MITIPLHNFQTTDNWLPMYDKRILLFIWDYCGTLCWYLPPTITDKKPRLSSMSLVKHKDCMIKSTLMAPKWTRKWVSGGHQPPFPEWWDNMPPTVQKTARQQHHLCSWGYSHQSGTELLPTHGPSPSRCGSLLWLNVLLAGNWGWRHREPFYLQYHEPALVIEWQGHTCSFLLGTKPLWHWRKWKSRPISKRDPRPWYRPTGKCPLYRYETTGQLLHSEVGSNQVGCSCTWQRTLSCETNTGATKEVPAPYQGWRGCNHPTSNWPYQGHQIPFLVPRTTNWLSPLWSNTDHWPYAGGVCIVTGMSWWILHSRLVECSLRDNSWDLHSRIPARSGILLSDMI